MNESNDLGEMLMEILTANDAKTQFGEMLLKVQREPIQIHKNGKPVAVVISMDEFDQIEALKLQFLQSRMASALSESQEGSLIDGDAFFAKLKAGNFD